MLFKILILILLVLILFFLGHGFYQIFIKKSIAPDDNSAASLKAARMLTWRVGLSLSLLTIIVVGKWFIEHTPQ